MPIRILENPKFRELNRRKRILQRGGLDASILITILGLALEIALLGGEFLFSLTMAELLRPDLLLFFWENFADIEVFLFAAYCLNYILVESLTVCMGFGIYINSRVEVEGWDIEILLRGFAERNAKGRVPALNKAPAGPGAALFLCLMLALLPLRGYAEASGKPAGALYGSFEEIFGGKDGEAPEEMLAEILKSPDFGGEREGWGIRFKNTPEAGKPRAFPPLPWMEAVKKGLAYGLRFCLLLALGGAVFFLFLRAKKLKREGPLPKKGNSRGLFAPLPEGPEALLNRAELFHRQGRRREAWACCFAGAVAAYERYRGIPFPPAATEYECLALARSAPGDAGGFVALVFSWVSLAYGGKSPDPGAFESSLAFCRSLGPGGNGEGETAHG
jgi:hypothetical protein